MTLETKTHQFAKLAVSLMAKHNVPPSPENYKVWFNYAKSENKELVREIDAVISAGQPFTGLKNEQLYLMAAQTRVVQTVDNAAEGTQKVLSELLRMVNEFNADTNTYSDGMDRHVQQISTRVTDPAVAGIVKEIVAATANLKERSAKLHRSLEESKKEVDNLRHNLQQVTTESQRDFLTHVYNRKALDVLLGEHVGNARRENTNLCLLMIDIDHFKRFNDKFGHLLGDEVLKIVAKTLTETLKGKDVIARFGGEEFAVLLSDTPLNGGLVVAETIRKSIAGKDLKRKDTGERYGAITVSIGVAQFRSSDNVAFFIKRADDALYASKRDGRNRVSAENPSTAA